MLFEWNFKYTANVVQSWIFVLVESLNQHSLIVCLFVQLTYLFYSYTWNFQELLFSWFFFNVNLMSVFIRHVLCLVFKLTTQFLLFVIFKYTFVGCMHLKMFFPPSFGAFLGDGFVDRRVCFDVVLQNTPEIFMHAFDSCVLKPYSLHHV